MNLNTVLYEELDKAFRTLLKTKISQNTETIKQNTLRIIGAFNGYLYELEYLKNSTTDPVQRQQIYSRLKYIGDKLKRVFTLINCTTEVKYSFAPLNFTQFVTHDYSNITMPGDNIPTSASNAFDMQVLAQILQSMSRSELSRENNDLIGLTNQQIPNKFSGEAKDRQDFLSSCRLLKTRATTPELQQTLFNALKTKLKGEALSCLPSEATTVDDIIASVENNLKVDSMPIIQQKLRFLKLANMSREKFKEQLVNSLEELGRAFSAFNANPVQIKPMIMEEAYLSLTQQTDNMAIHGLIAIEKGNLHSPAQLIDYFYTQLDRSNAANVLSFRQENRNFNNNRGNYNNNSHNRNNFVNRNNNFNNRNNNNSNNFNRNNYNQNNSNRFVQNRNRNNFSNNYYDRNNNRNQQNNNNNNGENNQYNNNNNNNQRSSNSNNFRNNSDRRNPRAVRVIESENYETHQSHGDMDGF